MLQIIKCNLHAVNSVGNLYHYSATVRILFHLSPNLLSILLCFSTLLIVSSLFLFSTSTSTSSSFLSFSFPSNPFASTSHPPLSFLYLSLYLLYLFFLQLSLHINLILFPTFLPLLLPLPTLSRSLYFYVITPPSPTASRQLHLLDYPLRPPHLFSCSTRCPFHLTIPPKIYCCSTKCSPRQKCSLLPVIVTLGYSHLLSRTTTSV